MTSPMLDSREPPVGEGALARRCRRSLTFAPIGVFMLLYILVGLGFHHDELDRRVSEAMSRQAHGPLLAFARDATTLGSTTALLLALGVATAVLLTLRQRSAVFRVLATSAACSTAVSLAKVTARRPRPDLRPPVAHASGYAFPSGHAANSVAVYGSILLVVLPWVARRWQRWLLTAVTILPVLAVALSRLVLGVHWLTDVLGGLSLGLALLQVSCWLSGGARPAVPPAQRPSPPRAARGRGRRRSA
ncbi:MAG: phosphoesterase [Frankiales bacterium]|nr:phosphoesterase [Frankiales bacterium]